MTDRAVGWHRALISDTDKQLQASHASLTWLLFSLKLSPHKSKAWLPHSHHSHLCCQALEQQQLAKANRVTKADSILGAQNTPLCQERPHQATLKQNFNRVYCDTHCIHILYSHIIWQGWALTLLRSNSPFQSILRNLRTCIF